MHILCIRLVCRHFQLSSLCYIVTVGFVFESRQTLLVDNRYIDYVDLLGEEDGILN
jgi:hypothetical protein